VAVNVEFQLIARRLARPPRRLHLDPRKLCRRNVRSVDKGVDESDRILGATCSRANPKCEPCAIPAARPPTPAYKSGREQMRDEIEETVERLTAREASREEISEMLFLVSITSGPSREAGFRKKDNSEPTCLVAWESSFITLTSAISEGTPHPMIGA
jgi:hypothetical protein